MSEGQNERERERERRNTTYFRNRMGQLVDVKGDQLEVKIRR